MDAEVAKEDGVGEQVQRLVEDAYNNIGGKVLQAVSGVARGKKDELLADYDLATRAVLYVVELKFVVWLQLPLVWCWLGHPDEGIARDCGKSGKSQRLATQDSAAHHHYTRVLLVIDGDVRDQFTLFLNGMSRSDLPELKAFIKPLR